VIVGSDVTLSEAACGLFDRADWQDALAHLALAAIPVAGARNSFAASIARVQGEIVAPVPATLNAVRCQIAPLDLVYYQHKVFDSPPRSRVALAGLCWREKAAEERGNRGTLLKRAKRLLEESKMRASSALISYLPLIGTASPRMDGSVKSSGSDSSHDVKKKPRNSANGSPKGEQGIASPSCSTCSLTDRENVYRGKSPSSSSASSSSPSGLITKGEEGDDEDDDVDSDVSTVAKQQPVRYTYTTLLSEGQLYFRSWQELDRRLGANVGADADRQGPAWMIPSPKSGGTATVARRPKPSFPAMPDLPKPLPRDAGWVTEVGDFFSIHILSHGMSADPCLKCLAPNARPDDGHLWLLLIRADAPKKELHRFFKRTEANGDEPLPPGVELLRVRGVRLAPLSPDSTRFFVDGRPLESNGSVEMLQAFVMPGVARTLVK